MIIHMDTGYPSLPTIHDIPYLAYCEFLLQICGRVVNMFRLLHKFNKNWGRGVRTAVAIYPNCIGVWA